MISLDLQDSGGVSRLVDIYPINETQVTINVDDDSITINPLLFKQRQKLQTFLSSIFETEEVNIIMLNIWTNDELEDSISLSQFDDVSKEKLRKFKSDEE